MARSAYQSRAACGGPSEGRPDGLGCGRLVEAAGTGAQLYPLARLRAEGAPAAGRRLSRAPPALRARRHVGHREVSAVAVRPRCCPRTARLSRGRGGHGGHPGRLELCRLPGRLGELPGRLGERPGPGALASPRVPLPHPRWCRARGTPCWPGSEAGGRP